jgi:ribosome-associated toxin RatA of RatAB toxin-antitoxin module
VQHEHTEHVAASPEAVYAAISDVSNLPRSVPQMTRRNIAPNRLMARQNVVPDTAAKARVIS